MRKKVKVTTLKDLGKMMEGDAKEEEEEEEMKQEEVGGDAYINGESYSRRKVKVTIVDEVTDYTRNRKNTFMKKNINNKTTRTSYMKVITHTVDVDVKTFSSQSAQSTPKDGNVTSIKSGKSIQFINIEAAGNLKRKSQEESEPFTFRKEVPAQISQQPREHGGGSSSLKRISIGAPPSNKVFSSTIEEEKAKKGPKLKSQKTLANLAGNLIKKVTKGFSKTSAFFRRDKKSEFQMNYLVLYKDFKQVKPK